MLVFYENKKMNNKLGIVKFLVGVKYIYNYIIHIFSSSVGLYLSLYQI